MQEFTRRLTQVRIRVMKGTRPGSDEYYLLKHQNYLLGIRPDAKKKKKYPSPYASKKELWEMVFDPEGERLYNAHFRKYMNSYELRDLLLCIDEDLNEAYEIRNELSAFFRNDTAETAPETLNVILAKLNQSRVPEMKSFGQTVASWYREILNSFYVVKYEYVTDRKTGKAKRKDHRLTSSMIENRNRIVKQIRNNANGYTNWTRFRNRVLYVLNRLAPSLEPVEKEKKQI